MLLSSVCFFLQTRTLAWDEGKCLPGPRGWAAELGFELAVPRTWSQHQEYKLKFWLCLRAVLGNLSSKGATLGSIHHPTGRE